MLSWRTFAVLPVLLAASACSAGAPSAEGTGSSSSAVTPTKLQLFASWNTAWDDTQMDNTFSGAIAATSWGPNRLDIFENIGGGLFQKTWWGSGAWSTQYFLANTDVMASAPAGVGWGGQNIDLVWRDNNNALDHFYWNGAKWTEENLSGTFSGRPSIAVASDGSRGDVFVRVGTSVWHRGWALQPNTWEGWEPLPITVTDDPVAVSDAPGRIELFYRGTDGKTYWYLWDGTVTGGRYQQNLGSATWTSEQEIEGYIEGAPAVAAVDGSILVSGTGGNDGIWSNLSVTGGKSWAGWTQQNGCARTQQVALSGTAESLGPRFDLFTGTNDTGTILHTFWGQGFSTTAGPTPICCVNEAQQLATELTGPNSTNVTFSNTDNVEVTVNATNSYTGAVLTTTTNGAGPQTVSFGNLVSGTTYNIEARAGGASSVCGWSQAQATPIPSSLTFPVTGQTSNTWTTFSFNAFITITPDGVLKWTTHFNNSSEVSDYNYVLDVSFPGYQNLVEARGEVGISTFTDPPQPVVNDSRSAWIKQNYLNLMGSKPGWSLNIMSVENGYNPGPGGTTSSGSTCSTFTKFCFECASSTLSVHVPESECTEQDAITAAQDAHPGYSCSQVDVSACP